MSSAIKVLLVDDHAMFRAGIKVLLEAGGRVDVVGEASSGDEAVDRVRELKPDVVVMDLSMPESNGLEATRRIAALKLDTKVLVLTVHAEEEYLVPVVEAGASGYLTKTSADTDLMEAIKVVARGQVFLPPKAATLLLQRYKANESDDSVGLRDLSTREQEVLALTAEGFSSREIGEKLFISPKTVDTYRSRIMDKLGLSHRRELVRFALRVGLLKEV
ncbi:MAG: response regulator transcription factor [Gemmatimonadales bacterium]|jgi:two-component system response regulator NreC|nr:response regulator transcription factor [Gemmatimonadales bacterium]MBT3500543.1 response regulator transcription factor [Gemmatimonadales bacterium]MBT3775273.1 response regulator transcription factor [Gemmatimonadales bacterium]MBT3957755.1 response regulator transcription factor [Gemmatimonadales bacterium]MBT4185576.1 response regulator transcription factor [Gemmatimonadales bacterium]